MVLKDCSSSEIRECRGHDEKPEEDVRDRLGELPDDILRHILSSLPTRDSARTSSLGKRWRNVWNTVPTIEIDDQSLRYEYREFWISESRSIDDDYNFDGWFMNFVDRVLLPSLNYEISCVRKVCLSCYFDYDLSRVRKWINVLTRLDHVEELDLRFSGYKGVQLPRRILTCKKLAILKLTKNIMLNFPTWVCLPSLKILHLISVKTLDVDSVKILLNGCPVLEELRIERHSDDEMEMKTLYVESSSLKSLTFYVGFTCRVHLLRMVIDATNLERLYLVVDGKTQIDVNSSLPSLVTATLIVSNQDSVSIEMDFCANNNVLELLMKMCNTKSLKLSYQFMLSLQQQRLEHLPIFKNLMHLQVRILCCSWPILPCFFESSPNLTSFVLFKIQLKGCHDSHRQCRTPKCLMLYLEKIDLSMFRGCEDEMELVSYFLKNAPVLKKMSILFKYLSSEKLSDLHGKILKLPKASAACEIEVRLLEGSF